MALTYAQAKEQFMGINAHFTTFALASGIDAADHEGQLLTMTDVGEVGVGSDGNTPIGVLDTYESGYGSVQDRGYVEIGIHDETSASDEIDEGDFVEVDGAGKGAKSTTYKGVICVASDKTNHKAIIKIG